MKKKIEKYLQTKNPGKPIRNDLGIFHLKDDIEGCLRAVRQTSNSSKRMSTSSGQKILPGTMAFGPPPLAPYATPMHPYSKRNFDMGIGGVVYSGIRYSNKRVCSESPRPSKSDLEALQKFFTTLKGGYVDGIWHSSLERRRMAEKTACDGSTNALNSLNLTIAERDRLPTFFRNKMLDPYQANPNAMAHGAGVTMPFGHMHWARPSPMAPFVHAHAPNQGNIFGNLKPSPLSRAKDTAAPPPPAGFMNTPRKSSTGCYRQDDSPLVATPMQRGIDGVFTPTLFFGSTGRDWGTPSWGGDDAKMLHDALSSSRPMHPAVTPAFARGEAHRFSDRPSALATAGNSYAKSCSTPRVFFKDQLTETHNFMRTNQASLPVSLLMFPIASMDQIDA